MLLMNALFISLFYSDYIQYQRKQGEMLVREIQQTDRQLQCDLDKLMKDIRHSEQNFQNITQHILRIINTSQSQNFIFVNQDIAHYRTIITKLKNVNNRFEEEYSSILQRYMQVKAVNQSSIIVMRRVAYRLLEIIFNSVGSINYKFPHILQEYLRLKINCQQIMQENTSYKPYPIFKYITDYSFKKINKYLDLFNELTNHLQNGHLDRFSEGQINNFLQNHSANQVKSSQTAKNTFFSTVKINKIRVKEKLSAKPQIHTQQSNTNTFGRKGKKLYDNLRDVIEVNKQEFIEGLTSFNQKNKDTLFKELLNRNKLNRQAIFQYSHKKKKIQNVINKASKNEKLQQTQLFHANQQSSSSLDCKPINTTRRILLVKLKASENSIKILPSQLFRKASKIQHSNRIKLKGYQRQRNNEKGEGKLLGDRLKQVLGDNNQEDITDTVRQQNLETIEEKLPFLSKRAQSVDQNYKLPPQTENNQVRTLSNSLKINESFKIKSKQKAQIHPVKVKLELKPINILASLQVSKKSVKLGEMSKCLYF